MDKRDSDVSPVDSPELRAATRDSSSSFCVSPIDETDNPLHHVHHDSHDAGPNPDLAATDPPKPAQKSYRIRNRDQPTRWDAFSGEPTTSNAGRAAQVTPQNATFHKPSGSHASNLLNWGREQFQPKKKLAEARSRLSKLPKNDSAPREPRDRSRSRVLPLKENSGNKRSGTTHANSELARLSLVPTTVTTITAGDSKPLPERPTSEQAYSSQPNAREYQRDSQHDPAIAMAPEPVSRFSSTTIATSSQVATPGGSIHLDTQSTDDLPSVMFCRRPIPNTSYKPVRKPTPSQAPQPDPGLQPVAGVPSEENPQSRIELWDAKRDELAGRRRNLETVIHELTHVIQPSSTAYDLAAKAEVKKTVSSIENEIAEIRREEHVLGLKITRAWRRLDEKENNGNGSSGLWVKRVTG